MTSPYAELITTSNFSFLRGASHPEELVKTAALLGYSAIAITDHNSFAGIVRGHIAAQEVGIHYIPGCRLSASDSARFFSVTAYPHNRTAYGELCRLLTTGKRRAPKGDCILSLDEIAAMSHSASMIIVPPYENSCFAQFFTLCSRFIEQTAAHASLSIALPAWYGTDEAARAEHLVSFAQKHAVPLCATTDALYHSPERRALHDVVTCIRERVTIEQAGFRLVANAERHLKETALIHHLYRHHPAAVRRAHEIAESLRGFSLNELRYEYPDEVVPHGASAESYLRHLVSEGAAKKYPAGVPQSVQHTLEHELGLIRELNYERYFLTCFDIVRFARERNILCQGRGAAANSAVCYCLGITAVDPSKIDLLFERFISKERSEPPDIDIDFEHERREEVIQYLYSRFGRDRCGLTAAVISFRSRSAIREVATVLGFSREIIDNLTTVTHRWSDGGLSAEDLIAAGLDPQSVSVANLLTLTAQLIGFPRHLSQHVGGFVISQRALSESVPILNAAMEDRTIIEWDKDDIEALGMLKIDILALGMLTCIKKALTLVNTERTKADLAPFELDTIPAEDPETYEMLCRADTVGVFQIESRAQMSMLPRLQPRCFYDLVIEVAIVRPGPIQGNMVHPFLRRRSGDERPHYPDERVRAVLGKTLGVPLFQEQAMRLCVMLAGFSPGEAEQLRRAMAAWKRSGAAIEHFRKRVIEGMLKNGYSAEFAETCFNQIRGFSEYGFPESHAASFALLVYVSAWLKCHYPAEFAVALLNSQPMGFYQPAQILSDAKRHGVVIAPIDIQSSIWDHAIEYGSGQKQIRLGMRLIGGFEESAAHTLVAIRNELGALISLQHLWHIASQQKVKRSQLRALARADAFASLGMTRSSALWELHALPQTPAPIDTLMTTSPAAPPPLPNRSLCGEMLSDYQSTGLSLRAHPISFLRTSLESRGAYSALQLQKLGASIIKKRALVAGIVLVRQRPHTAKGVTFLTLEDETGTINIVVPPALYERARRIILTSNSLLIRGIVERTEHVIYLSALSIEALSLSVQLDIFSRDFC